MSAAPSGMPHDAEIVANLWYVIDEQGFIYGLWAALYVAGGSDADKMAVLASRAALDYLVARPFSVPERYGTTFVDPSDGSEVKYAVIHHDSAKALGGVDQLFLDALAQLGSELPQETRLQVPEAPLAKVTALVALPDGQLVPLDNLS